MPNVPLALAEGLAKTTGGEPFVVSLSRGLAEAPISERAREGLLARSGALLRGGEVSEYDSSQMADCYGSSLALQAFSSIPGASVLVFGGDRLQRPFEVVRPDKGVYEQEPGVLEGRVLEVYCSRRAFDQAGIMEPFDYDWFQRWLIEGAVSAYGSSKDLYYARQGCLNEGELDLVAFRWEGPAVGRLRRRQCRDHQVLDPVYTTEPSLPHEFRTYYGRRQRPEILPNKPVSLHGYSRVRCFAAWFHDWLHFSLVAGVPLGLQDLSMAVFGAALDAFPWSLIQDFSSEGPAEHLAEIYGVSSWKDVERNSRELLRRARYRAREDVGLLERCADFERESSAILDTFQTSSRSSLDPHPGG